jgi:dethiobiotin synthetase
MKALSDGGAVFVTGIGTDIGKTIVSSILVEAFQADYWKPVQAGNLENSDSVLVNSLIKNQRTKIHKESYQLETPASPHEAAAIDNTEIQIQNLILPETQNTLIIEGAGGLMVPLNNQTLFIDFIEKTYIPVILISCNYLGSINHTLMTATVLQSRNIPVMGIVFNGHPNLASEEAILRFSGLQRLASIPHLEIINKDTISLLSATLDKKLFII